MGVEQQILTNLSKLPIDKQQEVLDFRTTGLRGVRRDRRGYVNWSNGFALAKMDLFVDGRAPWCLTQPIPINR